MKNRNFFNNFLLFVFSGVIACSIFITSVNTLVPSRDSGAFLYAGQQILGGSIPYRDFWDHKPPLIYYINALGLAISPTDLWGIWLLEIISLSIVFSVFISFSLKKNGLPATAVAFVPLFFLTSRLLEGGNRVEEFGLVLQAIILIIIFSKKPRFGDLWVGILSGLLFLLKPNLIGIMVTYLLTTLLFSKRQPDFILKIYRVIMSFTVTVGLVLGYLAINGALKPFLDQVIIFNYLYSQTGLKNKGDILIYFFNYVKPFSFLIPALPVYYFLKGRKNWRYDDIFLGLWIIIELLLCLLSRREYKQYFLTLVIPFSLFVSFYYKEAESLITARGHKLLLFVFVMATMFVLNITEVRTTIQRLDERKPFSNQWIFKNYLFNNFQEHQETIDLINKYSTPEDKILIWGSEPSILFITGRNSVDRYFYQFRLFLPGYDTEEIRLRELVNDVILYKPKLIISASSSTLDADISQRTQSPPLDPKDYQVWIKKTSMKESKEVLRLINFISTNYEWISTAYWGKWGVYLRK